MKFKFLKDETFFVLGGKIRRATNGFYETEDKTEIEELRKNKNFKEVKGDKNGVVKK